MAITRRRIPSATLVPVLLASDQTHLINFSGDKKLWPVYISIGNIDSTIRNKPTMHAWIPLALLPIPPKRLPTYTTSDQQLDALQTLHDIISRVLSPLSDAGSHIGIEMVCCDEKVRKCIPRLTGWLADHMENANLHCIATNQCPICIAPNNELGELPDIPYATRHHKGYAIAYQAADEECLKDNGVKNINNALWHITNFQVHQIVKPDILHTLLLSILVHLMKWIQEFLQYVGRLTVFDHIWSRLPPYPGFTRPNKAYRSVTQWQGKEMRNLLRVILGVFAASLSRTSDAPPLNTRLRTLSNKAILCVRYISDFILLAQYKTHTPGSIQSMKDYLEDFHKYKEVFLRFRATKAVKHAAKEAAREFRSEQRLNASDEAPAQKRQKQTQV